MLGAKPTRRAPFFAVLTSPRWCRATRSAHIPSAPSATERLAISHASSHESLHANASGAHPSATTNPSYIAQCGIRQVRVACHRHHGWPSEWFAGVEQPDESKNNERGQEAACAFGVVFLVARCMWRRGRRGRSSGRGAYHDRKQQSCRKSGSERTGIAHCEWSCGRCASAHCAAHAIDTLWRHHDCQWRSSGKCTAHLVLAADPSSSEPSERR